MPLHLLVHLLPGFASDGVCTMAPERVDALSRDYAVSTVTWPDRGMDLPDSVVQEALRRKGWANLQSRVVHLLCGPARDVEQLEAAVKRLKGILGRLRRASEAQPLDGCVVLAWDETGAGGVFEALLDKAPFAFPWFFWGFFLLKAALPGGIMLWPSGDPASRAGIVMDIVHSLTLTVSGSNDQGGLLEKLEQTRNLSLGQSGFVAFGRLQRFDCRKNRLAFRLGFQPVVAAWRKIAEKLVASVNEDDPPVAIRELIQPLRIEATMESYSSTSLVKWVNGWGNEAFFVAKDEKNGATIDVQTAIHGRIRVDRLIVADEVRKNSRSAREVAMKLLPDPGPGMDGILQSVDNLVRGSCPEGRDTAAGMAQASSYINHLLQALEKEEQVTLQRMIDPFVIRDFNADSLLLDVSARAALVDKREESGLNLKWWVPNACVCAVLGAPLAIAAGGMIPALWWLPSLGWFGSLVGVTAYKRFSDRTQLESALTDCREALQRLRDALRNIAKLQVIMELDRMRLALIRVMAGRAKRWQERFLSFQEQVSELSAVPPHGSSADDLGTLWGVCGSIDAVTCKKAAEKEARESIVKGIPLAFPPLDSFLLTLDVDAGKFEQSMQEISAPFDMPWIERNTRFLNVLQLPALNLDGDKQQRLESSVATSLMGAGDNIPVGNLCRLSGSDHLIFGKFQLECSMSRFRELLKEDQAFHIDECDRESGS